MIGLFSLSRLNRRASSRTGDVLRLVRTLDDFRSRRLVGTASARSDRALFFRDSQLVSGWGFAPVVSTTRRTRAHS
jgi:hypothetical protein